MVRHDDALPIGDQLCATYRRFDAGEPENGPAHGAHPASAPVLPGKQQGAENGGADTGDENEPGVDSPKKLQDIASGSDDRIAHFRYDSS